MRILFDNLIETASITASSEDASFVLSNLLNPHLTKLFKFTGNSESLTLDLGSAENIRGVVFDTNLTYSATVTVEGNSTNSFTSPPYSQSATILDDGRVVLFLDETYRYWKISFEDTSLTTITLKYGFIGDYTQMPPIDPDIDFEYGTTSRVEFSQTGQTYGFKGFEVFRSSFSFPNIVDYTREIDGSNIATKSELLILWRVVENIKPFYLVIFENSMDDIPPILGVFDQDGLTISKTSTPGIFQADFNFVETK